VSTYVFIITSSKPPRIETRQGPLKISIILSICWSCSSSQSALGNPKPYQSENVSPPQWQTRFLAVEVRQHLQQHDQEGEKGSPEDPIPSVCDCGPTMCTHKPSQLCAVFDLSTCLYRPYCLMEIHSEISF
jgi:hypothetical protein